MVFIRNGLWISYIWIIFSLEGVFMITDKKINKILSKIHPTEGEVKSMDEWEWITQVYIIKCFRAGMDYAINNKEQKA